MCSISKDEQSLFQRRMTRVLITDDNFLSHCNVNANTESLKSLDALVDTNLDYMLANFEPNGIVRNVQHLSLLGPKNPVLLKQLLSKR